MIICFFKVNLHLHSFKAIFLSQKSDLYLNIYFNIQIKLNISHKSKKHENN